MKIILGFGGSTHAAAANQMPAWERQTESHDSVGFSFPSPQPPIAMGIWPLPSPFGTRGPLRQSQVVRHTFSALPDPPRREAVSMKVLFLYFCGE